MVSAIISRLVILVFGTLYPAYASYKAVRTKNVKEYVKWMMYWIVFALFCSVETFSDVFLSWLPFYYELKIVFVLWMLSPMTQGSSFLFKKFVHPQLARREKDIDEMIEQASKQGYSTLVTIGTKGLQAVMRTAIMGQSKLVDHLRRSYSTSDLSNDGHNLVTRHEAMDEEDGDGEDELDNRLIEDNAELARRSKISSTKTRSSSSALSLSSVKEEETEDGEHVITETYTVPPTTRRYYSMREDNKTALRQSRCKSLPPSSDRFTTKPLVLSSTSVTAKKPLLMQYQSDKDLSSQKKNLPVLEEFKRYLLTRSLSQDSATSRQLESVSSSSVGARKPMLRALSEGREIGALDNSWVAAMQSSNVSTEPSFATQRQEAKAQEESESWTEEDMGDDSEMESLEEAREELRVLRRSMPRFFLSGLPSIDETTAMDFVSLSPHKGPPEMLQCDAPIMHENESPSPLSAHLLQGPKLHLLCTDDFGEELTELIPLDTEDNRSIEEWVEQHKTPVPTDDNQSREEWDVPTEEDEDNLKNIENLEQVGWKQDSDSDTSMKAKIYEDTAENLVIGDKMTPAVDNKDVGSSSELNESSLWETLSEASKADSADCQKQSGPSVSSLEAIKNNEAEDLPDVGSWSAPTSPATFARGTRHDASHPVSNPGSPSVSTRVHHRDEFTQIKKMLRRQTSLPAAPSREVIYSWPSPSHQTYVPTHSAQQKREQFRGHSFDPFQEWSPHRSTRVSSYQYQSLPSSLSGRADQPILRSLSFDSGRAETLYRRYLPSYKSSSQPSSVSPRPRSSSLGMGRTTTYQPSSPRPYQYGYKK